MRSAHRSLLLACVFAFAVTASWSADVAPAAPKKDAPKRVWQQLKADRLVADNSFLYASVPDVKKLLLASERSALRGLLGEEDMTQLVLKALAGMRDAYIKGDGSRSDMDLRRKSDEMELLLKLLPYADGHAALAVELPDAVEEKATTALPPFLIILSMPQGENGEERQRILEDLMERHRAAQCTDPRFKDFDDQIGPYVVTRVENPELNLIEGWSFVENLLVYGQGKGIVERALERFTRGGQGTLALSAGYQSVFKEVGRDDKGEALAYLQGDIRPLLKRVREMAPTGDLANSPINIAVGVVELLLAKVPGPHIAVGVSIPDGLNAPIREKMFARIPGMQMLKAGAPCTGVSARFVQSDALYFKTGSTGNIGKSLKEIFALFPKGADGSSIPANIRTAIGAQNDDEFFGKLDIFKGEFGLAFSYVSQPSASTESVQDIVETMQPLFFVELDADNAVADATARQMLSAMESATKHQYVFTKVDKVQVNYQQGAAPREEKAGGNELGFFANLINIKADTAPFFTAWARVDMDVDGKPRKFIIASDSLNAVKKAAQQAQAQFSRVSLAEDAQFKAFQTQFRETRQSLGYFDLKKMVDMVSIEMPRISRLAAISRDSVEQMPNLVVVKEFMSPMGWATSYVNDPEGAVVESTSPTGNLPLVAVAGAIAWPAIVKKQQEMVSTEIDANFQRIQTALHLYAADFDRLPPNLSDLYGSYIKKEDLKTFESPFRRGALKGSPQEIDNPDMTNLVYVPGRSLQGLGSDVVLYEREPTKLFSNRDGVRLFHHVITVDGTRTWMPRSTLERNLEGKVELLSTNVPDGVQTAPGSKGKVGAPVKRAPQKTPPRVAPKKK